MSLILSACDDRDIEIIIRTSQVDWFGYQERSKCVKWKPNKIADTYPNVDVHRRDVAEEPSSSSRNLASQTYKPLFGLRASIRHVRSFISGVARAAGSTSRRRVAEGLLEPSQLAANLQALFLGLRASIRAIFVRSLFISASAQVDCRAKEPLQPRSLACKPRPLFLDCEPRSAQFLCEAVHFRRRARGRRVRLVDGVSPRAPRAFAA